MLATAELIAIQQQKHRLQAFLEDARQVPLYREVLNPNRDPTPTLGSLPFLTKPQMRDGFPHNFLGADTTLESLRTRQEFELEHTSGTASERLPVLFGAGWWNEQEARALRLNPFVARVLDEHPEARRAAITSPACTGLTCPSGWLSREHRTVGNTLFVNLARIPFLLPETELERMAGEITDWAPQFLDVSPVHGARFAMFCEQRGIKFPSLRFVICSYEFVSHVHRRIIERSLGVPVFNLYGSTETGHLLMENDRGEMKSSRETAYLEVVDKNDAGIGHLVVTTLSNPLMPLLRYRIGDLVQHHLRPYTDDYVVHGRLRDALTASDGSRVTTWQVDQCFREVAGIAHYEIRHPDKGEFTLRFIPDLNPPEPTTLRELTTRLEHLLHARLGVQILPTLLPAASGKFRLTFPPESA